MSANGDLENVQHGWIRECLDEGGDLGLWLIIADINELMPGATEAELRRETLLLLRPLLESGSLRAADMLPDIGFRVWSGTVDDQLARIDLDWARLGRRPTIGEVVWFIGPE